VVLGVIWLAGCSAKRLEIAHDPLECLSKPVKSLADRLSDDELLSFSDNVFNQLEEHIITYQERHNTQCELIKKHNESHEQ